MFVKKFVKLNREFMNCLWMFNDQQEFHCNLKSPIGLPNKAHDSKLNLWMNFSPLFISSPLNCAQSWWQTKHRKYFLNLTIGQLAQTFHLRKHEFEFHRSHVNEILSFGFCCCCLFVVCFDLKFGWSVWTMFHASSSASCLPLTVINCDRLRFS